VSQKRARLTTKERKSSKYSVRPPLNPFDLPADVDERLNEWAYYFRDRQRLERCKSIEHRFQATSDDFAKEGWGDTESAPQVRPERSYALLRAIQTHEAIQKLDRKYRWIITYGYCYPGLPRFVVLKALRKFTGIRFTWNAYLDNLEIGRMRIYAMLCR
jgi:hypothetical protein